MMAQVEAGGSVTIGDDPGRTVIMSRAEYDKTGTSRDAPPPPLPVHEDNDNDYDPVTVYHMSAEQKAAYERMCSPETANFPDPLLVRVRDEVHAIYPDGMVQGPKDGTPR